LALAYISVFGANSIRQTAGPASGAGSRRGVAVVDGDGHRHEAEVLIVVQLVVLQPLVADQPLQFGEHAGRATFVHRTRVAGGGHMVSQDVERAEQGLGDFVGQLHLLGAKFVHHRLEDVGEPNQILEAERACAALNRVNRPEDGVDRLGVRLAAFHGQQALFSVGQELVALLEEGRLDALERIQRNAPVRW
jgi:hypothetical protein